MLNTLAALITSAGHVATVEQDTLHVVTATGDAVRVYATLTGNVKVTSSAVPGGLTVSAMRHGADRVAADVLAVL